MTNPAEQRAKTNFFRAGSIALWVWIVLALVPVVAVVACCGLCGIGGIIGGSTVELDPSSTPTP